MGNYQHTKDTAVYILYKMLLSCINGKAHIIITFMIQFHTLVSLLNKLLQPKLWVLFQMWCHVSICEHPQGDSSCITAEGLEVYLIDFLSLEKREAEQKVWLQVCLLGNAIEKSNTVDVSTRQHTDKRLRWLRPNYTQPWQQGLSKHKWKQMWRYTNTHLHQEQRHRTEVNMYTGSTSSCGTNICREKQLRQVERRKHTETYWIFHNVFTGLSRVQEVQFVCLCIFENKYADNFVLFLVCLYFCTRE